MAIRYAKENFDYLRQHARETPGFKALRGVHFEPSRDEEAQMPHRLYLTMDMNEWLEIPPSGYKVGLQSEDMTEENPLGFWIVWVAGDSQVTYKQIRVRIHNEEIDVAQFLEGQLVRRQRAAPPRQSVDDWWPDDLESVNRFAARLGYSSVGAPCF